MASKGEMWVFPEFPVGSIDISFLMCIYHSHIRSLGQNKSNIILFQ